MDELKISDETLEENVSSIKSYFSKQRDVAETFLRRIRDFSEVWLGSNYEYLLGDVEGIAEAVIKNSDALQENYVKFLNKKLELFKARPTFGGCAPATSVSPSSSSSASSSPRTPKTVYDKIFAKHNKDLVTGIYFYLRRKSIRFYPPVDGISFYDPDGISKRGLYKNIMAIDVNSPHCESDLMSLTAQHIFFQMRHQNKANFLRSVAEEINLSRFLHDVDFQKLTSQICSGRGINEKYLRFANENERVSLNFFTYCFKDFMMNNEQENRKYMQYYSNSYRHFQEILMSLGKE